jgi:hypothetical protein
MTLSDVLIRTYGWAAHNRLSILLVAVLIPIVGTILARIGKAGKTDADGRVIASVVVGLGLLAVILEAVGVIAGHALLHRSFLDADVVVLATPLLCLAGCLVGIRWVFPLNELASVRTFLDIGAFVLGCAAVLWLFSKFRGWGIVFFGGVGQLVVIALLGFVLLRRLYRRAFGGARGRATSE